MPVEASKLTCGVHHAEHARQFTIKLDNDEMVYARSMVIATGARYRKPALAGLEQFEGRGIYYGASFMEATFCTEQEVIINGGGNSAGQAAVFLARHARHVHIVVRGPGLAASMSRYLIQRIEASLNITLHTGTEIVGLLGNTSLKSVQLQKAGQPIQELAIAHVFLFLGAEPNTGWLSDCVKLDDKGFVLTGNEVQSQDWPLDRTPYFLETSRPGIFAVGDVRSGSVKRVAAAVGEGSAAIQTLHAFLAS